MAVEGIITDIHRGSVVDGPGIRTAVFLKGCALRCVWCHNPETQEFALEHGYGYRITSDEVVQQCLRDKAYYAESGGGATLSGGEPLAQPEFALDLLKRLRESGVHTVVDTCGYPDQSVFRASLPYTDLYLYDYKATSEQAHRELTGVSNDRILDNLEFLLSREAQVILRCPLIPGLNDSDSHLREIGVLRSRYQQLAGVELLPWHTMGREKYSRLGRALDPRLPGSNTSEEQVARYREFFSREKVTGISIPGHDGN